MIIGLDFDGTCVTHEFPKIGNEIGAIRVLKKLIEKNNKLILFTMRSNRTNGDFLTEAVNWFRENNIELYGIQTNPTQKIWTSSPKAHSDLYIDDRGLGIPLILDEKISQNPFVNWIEVEKMLIELKIL